MCTGTKHRKGVCGARGELPDVLKRHFEHGTAASGTTLHESWGARCCQVPHFAADVKARVQPRCCAPRLKLRNIVCLLQPADAGVQLLSRTARVSAESTGTTDCRALLSVLQNTCGADSLYVQVAIHVEPLRHGAKNAHMTARV